MRLSLTAALTPLLSTLTPRGGHLVASVEPSSSPPAMYAPFVDAAHAIFDEFELGLQPYPLAPELLAAETTTGAGDRQQHVQLRTHAYRTEALRQIRLVHIEGGGALQVLNFCIFPSLEYGLPTFSADLVSLPGGHLVAIDCQPNGSPSAAAYSEGGALPAAFERHRPGLPDGGPIPEAARPYFSPFFLWSRLPRDDEGTAAVRGPVLAAFEDYLRVYLGMVRGATRLGGAAGRASVRRAQLDYAQYRIDKDPARPMLTRLFGEAYCERLIRELLFDLPRVLEAESGEAAGGAGGEEAAAQQQPARAGAAAAAAAAGQQPVPA